MIVLDLHVVKYFIEVLHFIAMPLVILNKAHCLAPAKLLV